MPENQKISFDPGSPDNTVEVISEGKKDESTESNNVEGTQKQEATTVEEAAVNKEEVKEEGTPKEEAAKNPDDETNREIDRRVQKGVAKAKEDLKQVTSLLVSNPEKLKELKKNNPELYQRLESQVPELKGSLEPATEQDKSELASMVTQLLDANDEASMQTWANSKSIPDADYEARKTELKSKAKILLKEKLVPDWDTALDVAGGIVFPSSKTKSVDSTKLEKLGNQGATTINKVPKSFDDMDALDKAAIEITGVSKEEYESYTSDEIALPL